MFEKLNACLGGLEFINEYSFISISNLGSPHCLIQYALFLRVIRSATKFNRTRCYSENNETFQDHSELHILVSKCLYNIGILQWSASNFSSLRNGGTLRKQIFAHLDTSWDLYDAIKPAMKQSMIYACQNLWNSSEIVTPFPPEYWNLSKFILL